MTGQVTNPRLALPVLTEVQRRVDEIPELLPGSGYSLSYSGQSEDEEEAKEFLSNAFLYGVPWCSA